MKYKNLIIILVLVLLAVVISSQWGREEAPPSNLTVNPNPAATSSQPDFNQPVGPSVVARNLEIPWDLAFLPGGDLLVTERPGRLSRLQTDGTRILIHDESVKTSGEGGMLGLVLHPDFATNHYLYLYLTAPGQKGETENRVVRYRLIDDKLSEPKTILAGIPGAIYHDGGRMAFGPDGLLYITTGDATKPNSAQNLNSLGGKILRLHDDGRVPVTNPLVGQSGARGEIYSYGHRNPQGLAWDEAGRLWSSEHGRSGVTSGLDEINLIQPGANYGWPESEGDKVKAGTVAPARHSGTETTWAPASLAFYNGRLFFGGLRGEALYEAVLAGDKITALKTHLFQEFGRIRTVHLGPDGFLYLTTSNRDGRGTPQAADDQIIRLDPRSLD